MTDPRATLAAWYGSADVADAVLSGLLGDVDRAMARVQRVAQIKEQRLSRQRDQRGFNESIWSPRDPIIRKMSAQGSPLSDIIARLGCDRKDLHRRMRLLGIEWDSVGGRPRKFAALDRPTVVKKVTSERLRAAAQRRHEQSLQPKRTVCHAPARDAGIVATALASRSDLEAAWGAR